jgi:protein ImuB
MTRVEADTFPALVILPRSHKAETETKAVLRECAGTFSPRIEDRSEDNAFLCVIDIAGTRSLFGAPEMLARRLLQRVRAIGIVARVTISRNFYAAACLAKGLPPRMAVHVTPPGEEAATLAPLPLAALDLTEAHAETFALWGIHTLGMLASLPEEALVARVGQDGKRLQQLARGELPHLFQPVEAAFQLQESVDLDFPVEQLESLLFGLNVMLEQLILRAKAQVLALASITLVLALDGGGEHMRTVRPALPTTDKLFWLKLLQLDLEANPPQAAVLSVTLSAEPGSTSKVQLGLFSPQIPEAAKLDVTLARIRAIVGEENVGRAVLLDTHAMEAYRMEPFTVSSGESPEGMCAQPRVCLRQLRPPELVAVTLQNLRPSMLLFRQRRYVVERAYGPWLASGSWWNQTMWACEQWDLVAKAEDGALLCCCMVRNLIQNQWQMVALYD